MSGVNDFSDGMDGATSAFEADLSGRPTKAASSKSEAPTERVFDNEEVNDDEADTGAGDEDELETEDDGEDGDADVDGDDSGDDEDAETGEDDDTEASIEESTQGLDLTKVIKLAVDGDTVEVPLGEALQGFIRTETFHKRLNLLNEAKLVIEAERQEVSSNRSRYLGGLEAITRQLDELTPKEPNWEELYASDPTSARKLEIKWAEFKQQRVALDTERARAEQERAADNEKSLRNFISSEQVKILQAVPEWHDPKVREKERASLRSTGKAAGYSDEELDQLYDHRAVVILRKAAKYDRMMAAKPRPSKVVEKKPVAPGSGNSARNTVQKGGDRAMKQLARSGSIQDASRVFANLLK